MPVDLLDPISPLWPFAPTTYQAAVALVGHYTTASGPGDSAAQSVPSQSLGGFASTTAWAGGVLHDLFNRAAAADVRDGRADVRCVYFANPDPDVTHKDARAYLVANTPGAAGLSVGVDPRPVTDLDSLAPQAVEVDTAYGSPAGVAFAQPADYDSGVQLGDLPPGTGRPLWLRRLPAGAGAPYDSADLVVESKNGTTVRRIYWETEPYNDQTTVQLPPVFSATPSPFTRVAVDFLTAGGARVTWELDRTMVDPLPWYFQLQASQSGVAGASDWVDVGPPAGADALFLVDDAQRLYGASATLHYRVVLTTPVGAYVSPAANVYGLLTKEQWLRAREVMRKESLVMRRFVGVNGWLLKAKRYGALCSCVDPTTGEVNNSSDPVCFGTGYVGGYHPPVPLFFANLSNPDAYERAAYNEARGTVRPVVVTGRVVADLPVVSRDAWVQAGSDERYYVADVRELVAVGSTPVVYQVTLRLAPRSDVLYALPIARPPYPTPDWATPVVINL